MKQDRKAGSGDHGDLMFRELIESISHVVFRIDDKGHFTYLSPRCEEILGIPPSSLIGKPITSVIVPAEKDRLCTKYREVKAGTAYPSDYHVIDKNGHIHLVRAVSRPFTGDDGKKGVIGIISEITNWQTADEIRRESEEKYRMLVEGINHVIWTADTKGVYTYVSPRVSDMIGFTPEELIGTSLFSLAPAEDQPGLREKFALALAGTSRPDDFRIFHKDGHLVWVRAVSRPITEDGETKGITGIIGDISAWKRSEETLAGTEEKIKKIVEYSRDGIILTDENGVLIEWSPAMEEITGVPLSCARGKPAWDLVLGMLPEEKKTPGNHDSIRDHFLSLLGTGKPLSPDFGREFTIERPDKDRRTIESFQFVIPTEKGTMVAAIVRDITERKKSEDALHRVNHKLNLLSSVTRHDVLNQLMALKTFGYLAKECSSDTLFLDLQGKQERLIERIERQILFTKEYQEIGIRNPSWQNGKSCVDLAVKEIDLAGIELDFDHLGNYELLADPLLHKVFFNLIDNALRYGGETMKSITLSSHESGNRLVILCRDDGTGIPAREKEIIFERGYGKNTGFGLFLIRDILGITGISIRETGEPGTGARFEISVPMGVWRLTQMQS